MIIGVFQAVNGGVDIISDISHKYISSTLWTSYKWAPWFQGPSSDDDWRKPFLLSPPSAIATEEIIVMAAAAAAREQ